ncbi:MAG: hypothetical protein Tsb009_01050 [Planctomycetaceae bacterium]
MMNRIQLEQEYQRFQNELNEIQSNRSLRLGLLGVRGSCKTSLLASWYLFRADPNRPLHLTFYDEDTITYLDAVSEELLKNGVMSATGVGSQPEVIRFKLTFQGKEWDVETRDFSGADLYPQEDLDVRRLAERARDFLRDCDAIICLFRWNDEELETLNALDLCLSENKPYLILALTAFDEVGLPQNDDEFAQIVQKLEKDNPTLHELRKLIHRAFNDARHSITIPVAPLGGDYRPEKLPPGKKFPLKRTDLDPYNIYALLTSAIEHKQQTELNLREKLEFLKKQIQERKNAEIQKLNEQQAERQRILTDFDNDLEELKALIEEAALAEESTDEKFRSILTQLNALVKSAKDLQDKERHERAVDVGNLFNKRRTEHKKKSEAKRLESKINDLQPEIEIYLNTDLLSSIMTNTSEWLHELIDAKTQAKNMNNRPLQEQCEKWIRQIRQRNRRDNVIVTLGIVAVVIVGAIGYFTMVKNGMI